jgi:hypothetical protein
METITWIGFLSTISIYPFYQCFQSLHFDGVHVFADFVSCVTDFVTCINSVPNKVPGECLSCCIHAINYMHGQIISGIPTVVQILFA